MIKRSSTTKRQLRVIAGGTEESSAMNPVIKVAFATSDRKRVDQHFGSASAFVIYAVSPKQARLETFSQFQTATSDGHEDKLAARLDLLQGCAVVYCQAVGGSAIRQLLVRRIQPIKVPEGTAIDLLLRELQTDLHNRPPIWLQRILQQPTTTERFDAMAAEGWQE